MDKNKKYICSRIGELEEIIKSNICKKEELIVGYKKIGCDYCSGNYYECEDYKIKYENE